jgi:uncharacterized SAM-dependent methyltransferase
LLLGADLVKDTRTLELAYDDPLGVTAAFNLNVLRNVNALLGSDFDVRNWCHIALYDAENARIEMHLQARAECTVRWPGQARTFAAGERIHTENSYKYTLAGLQQTLLAAGFRSVHCYTDTACTFTVALAAA